MEIFYSAACKTAGGSYTALFSLMLFLVSIKNKSISLKIEFNPSECSEIVPENPCRGIYLLLK